MSIAKNGSAIINKELVPSAEVEVLRTLVTLGAPVTVPQVVRVLDKRSAPTVYTLMRRLHERRQLVIRTEGRYPVFGTTLKRVLWEPTDAVKDFFKALNPA